MTRIAHLTDVHLDGSAERRRRFEAALRHASHAMPDHLVITGDLTAGGELAHLDEMAACLGGWHPRRVTVVPGNHDVGPMSWEEMLRSTQLARFAGTSAPGAVALYPDAAIVAIDTQFRRRAPLFAALGKVSETQLRKLADIASFNRLSGRAVVVAMHHGPQRSPLQPVDGLVNREAVLEHVGPHVSVLCGHDHRSLDIELGPGKGRIFVAPSVAEADDPLRVYEVSGTRLVSVKGASAGQYMRGMLPF